MLGPLTVDGEDGDRVRDRVVLEALVVRAGHAVDKQVLAEALWGDGAPPTWAKMVQGSIVRLRRRLPPGTIVTTPRGYRIDLHEDQLDVRQFERMVHRAQEHLDDHDPDRASYVITEALALWRGPALVDLEDWEPGRAEATRLEGLRQDAEEFRVEAEIMSGRSREVIEEVRSLTVASPFRERRWALLARALYHAGRQGEALDAIARVRRLLREELGLDPGPELVALEAAILRQDVEAAQLRADEPSAVCPYRGLLVYETTDAESFFGRDEEVATCLGMLRDEGVLVIAGASGTGKSSLVRAGLVASLERDDMAVAVTTPGVRPLDSLAGLPRRAPYPILVVDQAEEAVTLCSDPGERLAYLDRVVTYGGPKLIAVRADRLGDLSVHAPFARLLERGVYLVGPMSEENLRAAIEGPAHHAGLRLEPGLVDLLVREVAGEPGALPLLSHALQETWGRREGPTLTVAGYRQSGGIRHAVAQSAERFYLQLDSRERRLVRDMFRRLVASGDGSGPVRIRVARSKVALDPLHDHLIEQLVDARLLSSDAGEVQIAHEALAREWPRLRAWLEEDVEGQRTLRHLSETAEAWQGMERPDSELYRGVRLAGAVDWADRSDAELTGVERDFLAASSAGAERELRARARTNARLRLLLGGIGVVLVAALVAGVLAIDAARRSDRHAAEAAEAVRLTESRRLSAQALAATDPDVGLLLGVEGARVDGSPAALSTIYTLLEQTSQLAAIARTDGDLLAVEVAPDGATVTVAGADGVALRDASTLHSVASTNDAPASGLAAAPDGGRVAYSVDAQRVGQPDNDPVRVLDAAAPQDFVSAGGLPQGSWVDGALGFSGDGHRLAAGMRDFESGMVTGVAVWDVSRLDAPFRTIDVHGVSIRVVLSLDGDTVYVATRRPDLVRAYDVTSGRLLASRRIRYFSDRIPPLALSPDGSMVATSNPHGILVMDAASLTPRFVLPRVPDSVSAIGFSSDSERLASGFVSGAVVVWEIASQRPVRTLEGHSQPVEDVAFAPDGDRLYSVATDRRLLSWDLSSPASFVATGRFPDNPRQAFASIPSPDGRRVAYLTDHGKLQFRDLRTGRLTLPRTPLVGLPGQFSARWSPDSREFVTSGGSGRAGDLRPETHTLQVWDPRSGAAVRTRADGGYDDVQYTGDGRRLVAVSEAGTVTVLDRSTLEPVGEPVRIGRWNHGPPVLTPDGRMLYVPLDGGQTDVVDLSTGHATREPKGRIPSTLAFSPDGRRVATMDDRNMWGLMPASSLGEAHPRWLLRPREFNGPNEFRGLLWSDDASQLITQGPGAADLWDAGTLEHLGTLDVGTADQTVGARAMPDGRTLVVAHPGGAVATWDLRPAHLVDAACRLAGRNLTHAEWAELVGARRYRATCPEYE